MNEREFREQWAAYFDARANKSLENSRKMASNPEAQKAWMDVAAGEQACAIMLRSRESICELYAALGASEMNLVINGKACKVPAGAIAFEQIVELAGEKGTPSVIWDRRRKNSGILAPGQMMEVSEGMRFEVCHIS